MSATMREREVELEQVDEKGILQKGIAEFYDESSGIWEDIWGDHMHHGFYDPDSTVSVSDHRVAQIRMIEEALRFAGVSGARRLQSTLSTKANSKDCLLWRCESQCFMNSCLCCGIMKLNYPFEIMTENLFLWKQFVDKLQKKI